MSPDNSLYLKEILDAEIKSIETKVTLYRQLKEQLDEDIKKYQKEGKEELAQVILRSLQEA